MVAQWANVLVVKTKRVSLFYHGLRNLKSIHGILFETCLAIAIAFIPGLDIAFGGRSVHVLHFFVPGLPFFIYIVLYNEIKKTYNRFQENKIKALDFKWHEATI